MAKVTIKGKGTVEVPDGEALISLKGKTDVVFACGMGMCGSCLAKVVEGLENLEPPNDTEKAYLDQVAPGKKEYRLLCQAVIKGGEITIEYPTQVE